MLFIELLLFIIVNTTQATHTYTHQQSATDCGLFIAYDSFIQYLIIVRKHNLYITFSIELNLKFWITFALSRRWMVTNDKYKYRTRYIGLLCTLDSLAHAGFHVMPQIFEFHQAIQASPRNTWNIVTIYHFISSHIWTAAPHTTQIFTLHTCVATAYANG